MHERFELRMDHVNIHVDDLTEGCSEGYQELALDQGLSEPPEKPLNVNSSMTVPT
jgi:hypothetical protein